MTRAEAAKTALEIGGKVDITFEALSETEARATAKQFERLCSGTFTTCYTRDFSYLELDNHGGNISIAIFFPPIAT